MGIGFEVTNDSGGKQVIDTAPLITFKDKFTIIEGNNDNGYLLYDNLFALKPSQGSTVLINNFLKKYVNQVTYYKLKGSGEVIRFNEGVPPTSNSDRFGLEVYNDLGVLQFSSNQKPLNILDVVYINDIRPEEYTLEGRRFYWSKNYGSKEVAVMMIAAPIWGEKPHFMTTAAAKRGNTLYFEAEIEHSDKAVFDYSGNPYPLWSLHALVLDVTGY